MSINLFRMAFCSFLLSGFVFVGCSSSTKTATKTDTQAAASGKVATETEKKAPASKPSSSLEEAQRGVPAEAGPLKDIHFDFDRYELTASARDTLKANAAWLKSNASSRVQIEGHADERGTNEYNLALGAKRAQSAKDYLTTLGIPAERISTISYGEELPVCREQTEECWQRNRRDRFVVQPGKPVS